MCKISKNKEKTNKQKFLFEYLKISYIEIRANFGHFQFFVAKLWLWTLKNGDKTSVLSGTNNKDVWLYSILHDWV